MKKDKKMGDPVLSVMHGPGNKMRVKLFDPKTLMCTSDRLVETARELSTGPSEVSTGPVCIEVTMYSSSQVAMLQKYLDKLRGELPIEEKAAKQPKTQKSLDKMLNEKEPLLDLLKQVKAKPKTQEDLMAMLREYNFMFVPTNFIEDYVTDPAMLTLKEKHADYQWMLRRYKEAKNPENDKFDYRLVFGIKILGDTIGKVQVYLWGKWDTFMKLPWKDSKKINFKKVEKIMTFPEMMDLTERKRWRAENRKLERNPELEPSKFYTKWKPYVKVN